MKKKISLLLVLAMILTVLPASFASVSAETVSPTYLVADFENGEVGNIGGNTYNLVDGPGASKYAVAVPDGSKAPSFDFCLLGSLPGASENYNGEKVTSKRVYDVSAWIRADADVVSDKVDFVFTMGGGTTSYTHTVNNAGIVKGQWVQIKTEIEYSGAHLATSGTVKVAVSDGIAYSMDDLTLICRRYKPGQWQNVNAVYQSALNSQTSLGTSVATAVNGWYSIGGKTTMTTEYNGTQISLGGSSTESISGRTASIKGTDGSAQIVCTSVNIKYGTTYSVYFMAKADNEDTIGNKIYLIFSRKNRDDTENLTSNFLYVTPAAVRPAGDETTISGEWRRYEATFVYNNRTYNTKQPNMSICVRKSGSEYMDGNPEFSIANFRIYQQTGTEHENLYTTGGLNVIDGGNNCFSISGNSSTTLGEVTNTITRITVPYNNGDVIVKSMDAWENSFAFNLQTEEKISIDDFKMLINAKDKDNYFGTQNIRSDSKSISSVSMIAEFDQPVWAEDMPNLTATVRYNAPSGDNSMVALCAMYDANNKMVSRDFREFALANGEGEETLSMKTTEDAQTAKVFLWVGDTYSPVIDKVCEISKTTGANFVYVDPVNGANNQIYGYYKPVKTMAQALSAVTHLRNNNPRDTYVILMPGDHSVTSTLEMKPSMTLRSFNVKLTSYSKNNKAVISGGTDLTGTFEKYQGNIWRAPVPVGTQARQLYVDGVKATVARSRDLLADEFTNSSTFNNDGSLVTLGELSTANSEHVAMMKKINASGRIDDVEMVFFSLWTNPRAQVASITENADGSVTFTMDNPAWKSINNKGSSHVYTPKYYENALELLDEENEWYLDSEGGYVYYWPRNGVDIGGKSKAVLATFDAYEKPLMTIFGTSTIPIRNVTFDNLVFADVTWTRPSTANGHSDAQNNHIRQDGDHLVEGVIDVKYADNVNFTNNEFTRLGTTAIRLLDGTKNSEIIGNEFYDLSSGAINVGDPSTSADYRYPTEANKLENIKVENNYIHHVARDHWSAAAISAGNPANTNFSHNEICNIPYSAFHIGYGWDNGVQSKENDDGTVTKWFTPTCAVNLDITDNYIHDLFQGTIYDGGAIYTNGISGGTEDNRSLITGNYITDIGPGAAFIYNDQGSTYYEVSNNVCDNSNIWGEYDVTTGKWKGPSGWMNVNLSASGLAHGLLWHTNYAINAKYYVGSVAAADTSNRFDTAIFTDPQTGEWCDEAKEIIANAGIEAEYRNNFKSRLQKLEVIKELNMNPGETFSNVAALVTSKREVYKNNSLVCLESSSNSSVATVSNGIITAKTTGTAVITYTVIEKGIMHKAQVYVTVS